MERDTHDMSDQEMPIFTRTYDLLTWLVPVTNHFPRAHRHTVTRRLLDAAFDLRERLEEANLRQGSARMERLALADEALARLRVYLRLTSRWGWLSDGQYAHVATMVNEIGRLLGGWQRVTSPCGSSSPAGRLLRGQVHGPACCGAARSGTIIRTCAAPIATGTTRATSTTTLDFAWWCRGAHVSVSELPGGALLSSGPRRN